MKDDTIAAVSSPPGPCERAVLRVSGPDAADLARATFLPARGSVEDVLRARGFATGRFDDGRGTQPALLLWMPGPRSYTREDVLELHLPGSAPLVAAALARLVALGARPADRGEFTRRAFERGRLDLSRAEGVLALVAASSEEEARAAAALLTGGLSGRAARIREGLLDLRTLTEASLDFDEADAGHVPDRELLEAGRAVRAALAEALSWEERRRAPEALPRVLLAGPPNAGKSTLFNALVPGQAALVAARAGTTRDPLTAPWELPGGPVLLVDTPGLDAGARGPDARAQELGRRERERADLVLWLEEAPAGAAPAPLPDPGTGWLRVRSKADLAPDARGGAGGGEEGELLAVSARSGAGLEELARLVARRLGLLEGPVPTGARAEDPEPEGGGGLGRELFARHRQALVLALEALDGALAGLAQGEPLDLVAAGLREATDALERIEGRTTPEDLLDRIFARFCLGK